MSNKLKDCELTVLNMTKALSKNAWEAKRFDNQKCILQQDHRRVIFSINKELREVKTNLRQIGAISGYCHETRTPHFTSVSGTPNLNISTKDVTTYISKRDREIGHNKILNAEDMVPDMPWLRTHWTCARVPRNCDCVVTPESDTLDVSDGPLVEKSNARHHFSEYETHMSSEPKDQSLINLRRANMNVKKQNNKQKGAPPVKLEQALVCRQDLSGSALEQNRVTQDLAQSLSSLSNKTEAYRRKKPLRQEEFEGEYHILGSKRSPPTNSAHKGHDPSTHQEPVDLQTLRLEKGCLPPAAEAKSNLYEGGLPSVQSETFKRPLVRNRTARSYSTQHFGTKDSAHAKMSNAAVRKSLQQLVQDYSRANRMSYLEKEKQTFLRGRVSDFVRRLTDNS